MRRSTMLRVRMPNLSPRNTCAPAPAKSDRREAVSLRRTSSARTAGRPRITRRSLDPFPVTIKDPRRKSTSPHVTDKASPMRQPVEYRNSKIAASRLAG
ncbi:MAG TPA: hypothetical protein DD637_03700 [Verrucomicrobia bacterium]|nr:hypothetical protein [Verrucomicrobiota bacterium]HCG20532.1 hypothetical protein [Verrucomicrobiota bacterium]